MGIRVFMGAWIVLFLLFVVVTGPAWYKHWIAYPALDRAKKEIQSQFQATNAYTPLQDFKGVLHSHSYWSHDSRGILAEILPAAQQAKLDFIFLSDHKHANLDTFPRGYHGIFEGIIIEAGTESHGMMITPMDSVVLDWSKGKDSIIRQVATHGGMAFYVHSEEPHDWANPDYHGMEIYNIHTDLKDEPGLLPFLINALINGNTYRHWAYRELYDDQDAIWARWDSLNQHRKIIGIAAVDAHDNQNYRARYVEDGKVEWVGPNAKMLSIVEPGWKEKMLLGEADTAGWAFRWGLDTYFHSFNFVNTHIFADSLSNTNLRDHLLAGHAYIAFESLAKAAGFQFFAVDSAGQVNGIMGDSIQATEVHNLRAVSPFPVQFQLIKDGKLIDQQDGQWAYTFDPKRAKGNYRLVVKLLLNHRWTTWVMTNPMYLY